MVQYLIMKKLLGILVLGLLLISSSANAGSIGLGELKLSDGSVNHFIKYLKGGGGKKPLSFLVTLDGAGTYYWFCPVATCTPGNSRVEIKICQQYHNGKECKIFARRRTIKWKNGINKGNKESKINSKWSDAEIRAKLTELGFLGEATSTEEKVSTTNEGNTVEQLKTLTKLYESGNLTKEEFDAAKKKVLND